LIAQRWHLDAGSITPPGVWNAIATSYLFETKQPAAIRHRTLAVLNMAMQDALVASWRVKLRYWGERPVTAIRRELDPGFEPLLVTPPFPGYVSGHAAVSAAAAGVLAHYLPEQTGRWHALAREAAVSRLLGGIHFVSDNEQGLVLGLRVAQTCLAAFEGMGVGDRPALVSAPTGMSPDFFVRPHMRARSE
jgi:membrane-associated phospholipid phosphatase